MALKDLKSDLSKFRIPKKNPLESKERIDVNRKQNQTPLSSMVESAPKIPRSQTTTNKEGVEPRKFDNSSQFLGETTPVKSNLVEKFLGETTPNKMDNSENFLGETTPKPADNSSQFLGETTPNKSNLQERFLGETDPNKFDNSENFLGETTPTPANNESRFLGETTPSSKDSTGQFLGETDPNKFDNSSNFLGETTPTPANNESRFLGETTPTPADNQSQFLGETTPSNFDNSSNFLGETDPNKFEFNPNHSDNGTTPTDVNNFTDIHAKGFTSKFGGVESSKFIGVSPDNTVFDGTTSLYSNIDDSKFTLGKTYEQSFDSAGRLNSGETGFGIGKAQAQRQSPSFLDRMYDKFNLKADSFNNGLGLFDHPLILRGIQRKGIGNGEPQLWGIGRSSFDDGLIRGGAVTSTTRALVDVARVGGWLASVEGVLWSAKQAGLQRTNKFGKIWTPANMLTAVGSQHIGLKPDRSGLLGLDATSKYERVILGGYKDKLEGIYKTDLFLPNTLVGTPFLTQTDLLGGFDSVYGIGTTFTTRFENTLNNSAQSLANNKANFIQTYEPLNPAAWLTPATPFEFNTYGDDLPLDGAEAERFGLGYKWNNYTKYDDTSVRSIDDIKIKTDDNSHPLHQLKDSSEIIKNYETVAYGKIPDRIAGDTQLNDFRSLLSDNNPNKKISESDDYTEYNINKRVNFGNPGKISQTDERIEWWKTQSDGTNTNRFDPVNSSEVGDGDINDLVHLWFQAEGGSRVQFRGTAKGITETFSPSWDSIKYNGRADQAYKYTTFERSLSFNFQVYATSRIEMKPIWRKLQYLSTMTMPQYGGDAGYQGTLVRFRLGSLYNNKLAFIESLSYNISDDAPWEISMLGSNEPIGELPMGIDVSIGLKILGDNRPQLAQKVYDWSF